MQSIGQIIKSNPKLDERFRRYKLELLNHELVQKFIEQNSGLLNDTMIDEGLSKLNEFVVMQNDPTHKPSLIIYNNSIDILYHERDGILFDKRQDGISTRTVFDGTTKNWEGFELKDFVIDPGNAKAHSFVKDFVESYRYGSGFNGMWLNGKRGLGKSFLMACMIGELTKRKVGVTYVGTSTFLDNIQDKLKQFNLNKNNELDRYRKAEILILDDIGTEYLTEWNFTQYLRPILEYRMNQRLATFFTSNYSIDEYCQMVSSRKGMSIDYSNQLKTRLDTLAVEVEMTGRDKRSKATFETGVYQ